MTSVVRGGAAAFAAVLTIVFVAPQHSSPAAASKRSGPVTLSGRSLTDAGGPFLPLGTTLFWGLWGEAHDPDRLDANLAWLAARGVDYVRVLGMAGGETWNDRRIDPAGTGYWPTVDRFLDRLGRHGLRAQITLFATVDEMMPKAADREAFVDRWAARLQRDRERFVFVEVANEHYNNGLSDAGEVRALGQRLASRTQTLVALSAPAKRDACALYAGSAADLATIHYPRDIRGTPWQAVARPWDYPDEYEAGCRGRLPVAVNNEPIGPGSSIADESDPERLALSYVTTFVSQNAAYVLHTGTGVRGGGAADAALGRPANLYDVPGLEAALGAIQRIRSTLPSDLPNWSRERADARGFPLDGLQRGLERGDVSQSFAAVRDGRFVLVVLGLLRPVEVTARRDAAIDVVEPMTGAVLRRVDAHTGQPIVLAPSREDAGGLVLVGR